MSKLTRRQLLVFLGTSAGTAVLAPTLGRKVFGSNSSIAQAAAPLKFTPVRLPHPLPIYQRQSSFLATGTDQGQRLNPSEVRQGYCRHNVSLAVWGIAASKQNGVTIFDAS